MLRDGLRQRQAERDELPQIAHEGRAEVAAIDRILDRRRDLALAAARVSVPDHIVAELGERPAEGRERVAWDGAVREIEGYRQQHGIGDRDTALGAQPEDRARQLERERAQQSIRRAQRELGIERVQKIERTRAMEIEL
jgi:hypothetical protein